MEKRLLNRRIKFKETATVAGSNWTKTPLASDGVSVLDHLPHSNAMQQPTPKTNIMDPTTRRIYNVFPEEKLNLTWIKPIPAGPGLHNLGNTCFLNSTLQCLTYTPPLALYLLSRSHSAKCRQTSYCTFCELERHVTRSLSGVRGNAVITPKTIVGRLKSVAKHLKVGRQEDSHEFLRYFVDSLQNNSLVGHAKLTHAQKETTVVHQIFGGYLQSRIVCTVCKTPSDTIDSCLDISLEVKHANTIDKAFQQFTKTEMLRGDNKYRCAKCKTLVDASKRLQILEAPQVLVIHLKRFEFGSSMYGGGKISKMVTFPEKLDLQSYMFKTKDEKLYHLYGVLVHSGHSSNSGHYYSYIKAPNGTWYIKNDSEVRQVSLSKVLEQNAYMLFYVAAPPSPEYSPKAKL
ncbi:hypothetical protein BJ741DRAFT_43582 [Chytriomyces cf. hyalinus JEL632]|nr:hypothetical protein BJ741DRAFT_43582 [Chytriomyces cf. hyalinus JEL632]